MKYYDSYGFSHEIPIIAIPVAFAFIGGAVFFPLAAARDHTVEKAQKRHEQTLTRNEFWRTLSGASDGSHLPRDLQSFATTVRSLAQAPNPAHALATYSILPPQTDAFDNVNKELGVTATYYPCDYPGTRKASDCGVDSPAAIDAAFALSALQATPKYEHFLENPVPNLKGYGLLSWRNATVAEVGGVLAVLVLTLFGGLLSIMSSHAEVRRKRKDAEKAERKKLAQMGPREREVYLLRKKVEEWPDTPERRSSLKKVDAALKLIREGEASAATRDRAVDVMRDLDEVVAASKAWQSADESWRD